MDAQCTRLAVKEAEELYITDTFDSDNSLTGFVIYKAPEDTLDGYSKRKDAVVTSPTLAATSGSVNEIKHPVMQGVDVDARYNGGNTTMAYVTEKSHSRIMELFKIADLKQRSLNHSNSALRDIAGEECRDAGCRYDPKKQGLKF